MHVEVMRCTVVGCLQECRDFNCQNFYFLVKFGGVEGWIIGEGIVEGFEVFIGENRSRWTVEGGRCNKKFKIFHALI